MKTTVINPTAVGTAAATEKGGGAAIHVMTEEEFLAGLKSLEDVAPESVAEELVRLHGLLGRHIQLRLPPIPVKLVYDVDIELPPEFAVLARLNFGEPDGWFPTRATRVEVEVKVHDCEDATLEVTVQDCEEDASYRIEPTTVGRLAAVFLLWCLIKQHHGIDFLADLKAKLEERRDWLLQLKSWLDGLVAETLPHATAAEHEGEA
ncbi:MAG: hypothetical protein QXF05_04135 [Thermofilaceae archaeon]